MNMIINVFLFFHSHSYCYLILKLKQIIISILQFNLTGIGTTKSFLLKKTLRMKNEKKIFIPMYQTWASCQKISPVHSGGIIL